MLLFVMQGNTVPLANSTITLVCNMELGFSIVENIPTEEPESYDGYIEFKDIPMLAGPEIACTESANDETARGSSSFEESFDSNSDSDVKDSSLDFFTQLFTGTSMEEPDALVKRTWDDGTMEMEESK